MFYATRQYIEMITSALSTQTNVNIYESDKWAVDAKSKTLYYDAQSLKDLPFYVVKGILLHEVSHLLHTQDPVLRQDYVDRWGAGVLHNVYNPFEDVRIERKMVDRFDSYARDPFRAAFLHIVQRNIDSDISQYSKIDQFLLMGFLLFYMEDNINATRQQFNWLLSYRYGISLSYLLDRVDFEVKKRFMDNKGVVENIFKKSYNGTSTQEVVDEVDTRLIPLVQDFLDQDKEKRDQDGEGEGDSQGQPEQGAGKQKMQSISSLTDGTDGNDQAKGRQAGYGPNDKKELIDKAPESEVAAVLRPYISTLTQRLQSILQEKAHTRWRGSHLSGKLLNKNAYKVTVPNETRIFSKKTTPDVPHYHIYLALDASGSMGDNNAEKGIYAYMGAVLMKKVAENLKFKMTIIHFDTMAATITDLYKEYRYNGGGTSDSSAFHLISKTIKKDENNLIFVLTDGETNHENHRQEVIDQLENKYNAYVFGIGIGDDISRDLIIENYKRGIQVKQVQDVPQKLVEVIRSVIKR